MDPLVSAEWLLPRLADADTVTLDATLPPVGVSPAPDVYARYLAGHLPGAVFFDVEALSDHATPLPHMLPRAEVFAEQISALGVGSGMTLVVYEQEGVFSAPRAWWMLRTFGVERVYVLDGGLRAWIDAGLPTQAGPVQRPHASFQANYQPAAVASYTQVQEWLAADGQVLDARPRTRFLGSAPEPRPGICSGHMPGAINVPLAEIVEAGRFKSASALRELFAAKGVDLRRPAITTCGSGITAAALALGLALCGAGAVRLYDGSWAEYAQQPASAIVTQDTER